MATINLTVYGHEITCTNEEKPVLSQGSHNIDTVIFTYDSTYSGYKLYATMYQSMSDPVLVELSNDSCKIPIDALRYPGKVRIGLRAEDSNGSVIATSCLEWFNVEPGAIDGSEGTSTSGIASLVNRIAALEAQNPPDASTAAAGQVLTADGAGGHYWGDIEAGDSVPTNVRQAIFTLLNNAIYRDTDLRDEKAIIQSWATEITAISVSPTTLNINGMNQQTIVATTQPAGGIVSWSSSDESIATVSGGVVTPTGVNGTCTITASCGGKSATCAVTVSGFATLLSISAVYTQSGTVYDTASLDSLKSDLVIAAHYDDGRSVPVTGYTLSGTLEVGTSTITVAYGGKTANFSVTVTHNPLVVGYRSIGTPTISGNIFTPSSEGYIMSSEPFAPGEDSWAIRAKLVTSTDKMHFQNLIRTCDAEGNSKLSVLLQHKNGASQYTFNLSSNGTSADLSSTTVTINDNTETYIELAFDGTETYSVRTSTDGATWETVGTATSSGHVYSGAYIGFCSITSGTYPYAGSIYLDSLQFYIGGELRWKAVA